MAAEKRKASEERSSTPDADQLVAGGRRVPKDSPLAILAQLNLRDLPDNSDDDW
jgi:hypothetical protein